MLWHAWCLNSGTLGGPRDDPVTRGSASIDTLRSRPAFLSTWVRYLDLDSKTEQVFVFMLVSMSFIHKLFASFLVNALCLSDAWGGSITEFCCLGDGLEI